jgi:DNA-binding transcriptional MerR regulator
MVKSQTDWMRHAEGWKGTAGDLVAELRRLTSPDFPTLAIPSIRTIRLWRAKDALSDSGSRGFSGRQLLEAVAILFLQHRGWSLAAIADLLPQHQTPDIATRLCDGLNADWTIGETSDTTKRRRAADDVEVSTILLAQGAIKLYDRILSGREIVRQDDALPTELHQAMCLLGRAYIEEGKSDQSGCIHDLLDRARRPLNEWGLNAFSQAEFRFRDALLIDPDLRVPTQDAIALATSSGQGIDDIIENQLHTRLRETVDRLGPTRNAAYTAVREFVARHSLASETQIRDWFESRRISAIQSIVDDLYDRVPDCWLISGLANRCAWCRTLLRPHPDTRTYPEGKCPLRQCAAKHAPRAGEKLSPSRLHICRPQVLMYWVGPAIDELEIFDAAREAGLDAELYPEGDRCDISIGSDRIGIDVKCYNSPVSLALKLNKGIGGLIGYRERILAIPDAQGSRPGYLEALRASLEKQSDSSTLQIRTVGAIARSLREGALHA